MNVPEEFSKKRSAERITMKKWQAVFYIVAFFMPVVMFLNIHRLAVNVPIADGWALVPLLVKLRDHTLTLADLWAQHNEHRPVFLRVILLLLASQTQYNATMIMYFGFAMRLLSLFLVWRLLNISLRPGLAVHIPWLTGLASLLLFSTTEYEIWTWDWASIHFNLAVLSVIATIWALARGVTRWFNLLIAAGCAIVGTLTIASGLLLWGVGLLGILAYPKAQKRNLPAQQIIFWLVIAAVTGTAYFVNYHKPTSHPDLLSFFIHPLDFILYIFTYLGTLLGGESVYLSALLGFLGVGTLAAASYYLVSYVPSGIPSVIPWLLLITYAILSAVITAMGRVGFGLEQATTSRYASTGSLFFIGTFAVLWIVIRLDFMRSYTSAQSFLTLISVFVTITFLLSSYVLAYVQGYTRLEERAYNLTRALPYLYQYETAPKETLQILYPSVSAVRQLAKELASLKMGPFANFSLVYHHIYAEPPIVPAKTFINHSGQNVEISQTFVSQCQQLGRLDLMFHNSDQTTLEKAVTVRLLNEMDDQTVYEQVISKIEVGPNIWQQFLFEPSNGAMDKHHRVVVQIPSSSGNSLGVWHSQGDAYPHGQALIDGTPIEGDLVFRYGCAQLDPASTNWLDLGPGFAQTNSIIKWETVTINGQKQDVIFAYPPASIAWPIILPESQTIHLQTAIGLSPEVWRKQLSTDGVMFYLYVDTKNNDTLSVFSEQVVPSMLEENEAFTPISIDLSPYAGQSITIRMETDPGPAGEYSNDYAGWIKPTISVGP